MPTIMTTTPAIPAAMSLYLCMTFS